MISLFLSNTILASRQDSNVIFGNKRQLGTWSWKAVFDEMKIKTTSENFSWISVMCFSFSKNCFIRWNHVRVANFAELIYIQSLKFSFVLSIALQSEVSWKFYKSKFCWKVLIAIMKAFLGKDDATDSHWYLRKPFIFPGIFVCFTYVFFCNSQQLTDESGVKWCEGLCSSGKIHTLCNNPLV